MKTIARRQRFPTSPVIDCGVTQPIITDAVERRSGHCIIAEAIKAACPWAQSVSVDLQSIRMSDPEKGLRYCYLTPRSCQQTLLALDQGRREFIVPFHFRLAKAHIARMRESSVRALQKARAKKEAAARAKKGLTAAAARGEAPKSKRDKMFVPQKSVLVPGHNGEAPRRVGGRLPPRGGLQGARREYGLRAMSLNYPVGSPERGNT